MSTPSDIEVQQGATFELEILVFDGEGLAFDLTGATARMQVRETFASSTVLLTPTVTTNGVLGTITITATAATTAALTAPALAVYDIELVMGDGKVYRLCQGECEISAEVTRS